RSSPVATTVRPTGAACGQSPTSTRHQTHTGDAKASPVQSIGDRSVAVVLGLVRAFDLHADVFGLVGTQLRELRAEAVEVQARDALVELLGQRVDLADLVAVGLAPQRELRDHLVREAHR